MRTPASERTRRRHSRIEITHFVRPSRFYKVVNLRTSKPLDRYTSQRPRGEEGELGAPRQITHEVCRLSTVTYLNQPSRGEQVRTNLNCRESVAFDSRSVTVVRLPSLGMHSNDRQLNATINSSAEVAVTYRRRYRNIVHLGEDRRRTGRRL